LIYGANSLNIEVLGKKKDEEGGEKMKSEEEQEKKKVVQKKAFKKILKQDINKEKK